MNVLDWYPRIGWILLILAACIAVSARAQSEDPEELAAAMRVLVAVETPRGPVPVRHCRRAGTVSARAARSRTRPEPWDRCDRRLMFFANAFVRAGHVHDVDPWVLAAMARQESGLNPFAIGPSGEGGVAQLHPRGIGRRSRFVRNESFRGQCTQRADACQQEVIDLQAEHLRSWIDRCDGNLKHALGGYNSGHCGLRAYVNNVLRHHRRLWNARENPR